jgi:hypothetical protein
VLQSTVIGLDRIIGILLDVVLRLRDQFFQDAGVDRGGVGDHLAGRKNLRAASLSRRADTSTSMTCPYWSTARYTYRQTPFTLTYVSSTNHRSPGEWRQNRAVSASSGVNRCTHRQNGDVVDLHAAFDQ